MGNNGKRLFEIFNKVNGIKAIKSLLLERYVLDVNETFMEYHRDELNKIINEVNNGVEHEYWNLIKFSRLKKIWEDYIKLGFVRDENGVEEIKEICLINIAKLNANTELVGHTSPSPRNVIFEEGYCFKDPNDNQEKEFVDPKQYKLKHRDQSGKYWSTQRGDTKLERYKNCDQVLNFTEEEFFNRLDNYIGDDTFSDYALEPLNNLFYKLFETKTSEEALLMCDRIFNVVHMRGDIAALFVEGGSNSLSQLSGEHEDAQVYRPMEENKEKQRLFEIFDKVNNVKRINVLIERDKSTINEQVLPREEKNQIIKEFVQFVNDEFKFGSKIPNITISYKENQAEKEHSFGHFIPQNKTIRVIATNRNLADVLRTLAHELVHYKQLLDGKLNSESGKTGSNEENEANAMAGVLLREFGKTNPVIYE